jgi:TPR repeat protein
MKLVLKYLLIFIMFTSLSQAKVGVCEVLPDAQKDKYLECLVQEAERTDDVADINMVAFWYETYRLDEKMFYWYNKSIKKGNAKAMYKAARRYHIPKFNQPNKSISLYKQAALKNYKDAIAKLSELMQIVYGKEGAVKEYKKQMASGDKNTYRFLANLYVRYKDYDKALELYENALKRDAINKGDVYALIGSLYEAHYRDKKEAKLYYEKAAKEGNAISMFNLGIMAGDKKDYKKAEEWFRASEKAEEKNTLGMICYMYKYKMNDYDRAEKCYLENAKDENYHNLYALGLFYMNNMKNYKKGVAWYEKAYKAGSSSAAINLGSHYRNNYHGDYNKEKAIYWYKKAAAMGKPGGWSYLYGEGAL